jgi:hypothetical protein
VKNPKAYQDEDELNGGVNKTGGQREMKNPKAYQNEDGLNSGLNTTDRNAPYVQATITSTGMMPNDSMINDEALDAINVTPDRAQQDQMVDGPEVLPTVELTPPPGSYTGHTDITENEGLHNMLSDRRYTMRGEDR